MDYLQKIFKRSGWMSILISAIFAVLGIILIWKPDETIKVISYVLGTIFIIIGLARVINYVSAKGKYDLYNYDIIFGILAIIIGIVTMVYSNAIATLLNIVVGIWIIYSGLIRLSVALKVKKQNVNAWLYILILALIMLACGIYVIFNVGAIVTTIGIILLIYSIIDIAEEVIFMRNVKELF